MSPLEPGYERSWEDHEEGPVSGQARRHHEGVEGDPGALHDLHRVEGYGCGPGGKGTFIINISLLCQIKNEDLASHTIFSVNFILDTTFKYMCY